MRVAIALAVGLGLAFSFARLADQSTHLAGKRPGEHLPGVAEFLVAAENGGSFVAGVNHAILAARIAPAAVLLPRSLFDEFLERLVVRVGHQVARAFPATRVVGGIAPGGAHQLALAAQEIPCKSAK